MTATPATPATRAQSATTTRSTVNSMTAAAPSTLAAPAAGPAPVLTTPLTPTTPTPTPAPATVPDATRPAWDELVEAVRESGQYETSAKAAHVTRIVLTALGGHVVGDERVELAHRLPEEAARLIASQIPVAQPLTAAQFVDRIATRIEGATPATARWDVSSVLGTLPRFVGDTLIDRVLADLPSGYALLFGRPQLLPQP